MSTLTLVESLRAMARYEHDDLSLCADAAGHIEQLNAALARKDAAMSALREWMRCADWMRFAAEHEDHAAQFPTWEKS